MRRGLDHHGGHRNFFNIGTTLFGLGYPGFSNANCFVTTPFSFSGGTPADCIANNKKLTEVTVGFWQNVYKGDYGRVAFGAQYEYIKRNPSWESGVMFRPTTTSS